MVKLHGNKVIGLQRMKYGPNRLTSLALRKAPTSPGQIISAGSGLSSLDVLTGTSPSDTSLPTRANLPWERAILRKASLALVTLLIVFAWTGRVVNTYAAGGLSLSPPLKEVTLGPGLLQADIDITLKNNTGNPVNASYKLIDLKALGTYGGSTLDKAGLPDAYNLANWMTLPAGDTQRINGNETATIKVTIDNRSDLAPGGHYGALVIATSPEGSSKSSVSLNQQIVSFIFVKKLGGEKYGLDLESFTPNSLSRIPDSVELHFKNTGNVHVVPRGYIEVTDPKGKLISKGIINPESTFVIPETSRQFVAIMQPVSNARPGGRYAVTVHYRYDGQEEFSSESIFINQPLVSKRTIILLTGGFTILLLGLYLAWRRRHRHSPRKTKRRFLR